MTGTGIFLRTFLRRDRWLLLWWSLGGMLLYWSQAISVQGLHDPGHGTSAGALKTVQTQMDRRIPRWRAPWPAAVE